MTGLPFLLWGMVQGSSGVTVWFSRGRCFKTVVTGLAPKNN